MLFSNSVYQQINIVDCGLFPIRFIHNILILRSSSLFNFSDRDDYFIMLIRQSNLISFENNDIYCMRKEMKNLMSTLALTYRCCLSMRITGEAKLSKGISPKSELSVSVIPVDENKKDVKTLVLSSALTELVVDSKGNNKFHMMVKTLNMKR